MSKKPKKETKKDKRTLRCQFTDEELLATGKRLAEHTQELTAIENDKKRVMSDFTAKIKARESEIAIASNAMQSGYEFRNVECTVHLNDPKAGRKRIVRDDTDEEVGVEDMTEDEMQPVIPGIVTEGETE